MKTEAHKTTFQWHNITVQVRHVPDWHISKFGDDYHVSHIEVVSLNPPKAPLPITETGYRSHFTSPQDISAHGGAVELVKSWLDQEAKTLAWKRREQSSKQLSLF